ncbi:Septum formation initiator [Chitinophaga costaii]|uniref:Septum formation initiator n=1 Tax=Chitinophaga costaii TaxID=1335309 RepID=A0A1C4F901_9BACT|nr:septum formation initiator [Chitinophaga costaii]PUZ21183.1 septum formation initiator [Chitinophaga costaii]SCC52314.1 Septum formation initiator [Chitinophaga costaii]
MEEQATATPSPKFKLPPYLRNKYLLTTVAFVLWVAFFDEQNLLNSFHLSQELSKRESQKTFYIKEIEQTKKDGQELLGSPAALEKFAREKYHFKKDNEDLFIVNEKQ